MSLDDLADITNDLFALESFLSASSQFIGLIFNSDVDNLSPRKLRCQYGHTKHNERKAWAWDKYENDPKQDESRSDRCHYDPTERVG
jgi:hypothetical protein